MTTPGKKLSELALRALKLDLKMKELKAQADEAKLDLIVQLEAEGMFDPDTKAIDGVKLNITPNRYFDLDFAISFMDEESVEDSKVTEVDAKLLKEHMTPRQLEQAMKDYPVKYKVGLAVNK